MTISVSVSVSVWPYRSNPNGPRVGGRRCKMCITINESTHSSSTFTGLTYKISHHRTCKSRYCVYLITCKQFSKQYTGSSTDSMHIRHGGHRREIRQESTELGRHLARCGDLSIQIIDCVKEGAEEALRYIEGIWQNRLATFEENGGNLNIRNELRRQTARLLEFIQGILG